MAKVAQATSVGENEIRYLHLRQAPALDRRGAGSDEERAVSRTITEREVQPPVRFGQLDCTLIEEADMFRCASLIISVVALSMTAAAAAESTLGTAIQHEEWSRKFMVNGSTTRETMIDDRDVAAIVTKPNYCGATQSVFETTSARHWHIEPCG